MRRPDIPEAIKRQVRKECYFGCVLCGMPFFQYDHITEYSENPIHEVSNLALLCPNHHSAKSTHKLTEERVREARLSPYNANRPFTSGLRIEASRTIEIKLGSNTSHFVFQNGNGKHNAIWVNGKSFLTLHATDHWLSISMLLTDSSGNPLLHVENGELSLATTAWDYSYTGSNIKIRTAPGELILDLDLTNDCVKISRGGFFSRCGDGFFVEDPALYTIVDRSVRGMSIGSSASNNQFGSWGLLNKKNAPEISSPGGVGFFTGS